MKHARNIEGALALLFLAACSGFGEKPTLTVLAAASLTATFEEAGPAFAGNGPADVRFSFAGSQILRHQIEEGAPADVFIAASEAHVRGEVAQRLEAPVVLTCNEPVLIVARGSSLHRFEDLPSVERVVLGTPEVPIGAYSEQILAAAGQRFGADFEQRVRAHVVSRELDVRQVLAKVASGEADAAIVYRTDARDAAVQTIEIPAGLSPIARYPIAILRASAHQSEARAWLEFLRHGAGHAILTSHGFIDCPDQR